MVLCARREGGDSRHKSLGNEDGTQLLVVVPFQIHRDDRRLYVLLHSMYTLSTKTISRAHKQAMSPIRSLRR
jgi:hypothetical protein